jgi:hypothetical protein
VAERCLVKLKGNVRGERVCAGDDGFDDIVDGGERKIGRSEGGVVLVGLGKRIHNKEEGRRGTWLGL